VMVAHEVMAVTEMPGEIPTHKYLQICFKTYLKIYMRWPSVKQKGTGWAGWLRWSELAGSHPVGIFEPKVICVGSSPIPVQRR
jgi:hypothetical protein